MGGDVSVNSEDNVSKTSDPAPEVSEATTDDPLNFNPLPSGAPPPCPGPERVSGTSRFRRWKERNSTPDSKAPDPTTGVPKPKSEAPKPDPVPVLPPPDGSHRSTTSNGKQPSQRWRGRFRGPVR